MDFIASPTERTTAVTDVILALIALAVSARVYAKGPRGDAFRARIWSSAFLCLAAAAAAGAAAHGLVLRVGIHDALWHLINLTLAMTVTMFLVGTLRDGFGVKTAKRFLPILILLALVFFAVTVVRPGSFLVFIVYESVAMLAALVIYLVIGVGRRFPGAGLIAAAILVTVIAAGIQASGAVRFTLIWEFDHNGLFHLVQMAALPLFLFGIQRGFED